MEAMVFLQFLQEEEVWRECLDRACNRPSLDEKGCED